MNLFPEIKTASHSLDDALMAPWAATGVIAPQDARLFAAALVSDPAVEDDLAAARAEHAVMAAMGEALGRPSMRPLLALFAAIDEGAGPVAANVTKLKFADPARLAFDTYAAVELKQKKMSRVR